MRATPILIVLAAGGLAHATPTDTAKVGFGAPVVEGAIDTKALTAVLKRSSDKLLACYKVGLAKASAQFEGLVTAKFRVEADGTVTAAAGAGLSTGVETCIAGVISKLRFTRSKDAVPADISIPLMFSAGYEPSGFEGDDSRFDDTTIYGGLLGNESGELPADDRGLGQGGAGWGTIGTGRYGTIGHGSGYGVGGGRLGMRGRTAGVPSISLGQPTSKGDLDKAIIRRYIKRDIQKLEYCYEKQLLAKPGIKGTVTVAFTIGADGLVSSSTAKGMKDKDVEACVAQVIQSIEFPKPKAGEVVVSYPLIFKLPEPRTNR